MNSYHGPPTTLSNFAADQSARWIVVVPTARVLAGPLPGRGEPATIPMAQRANKMAPCLIKLGIPADGFGAQLAEVHAWLRGENCGAGGWMMTRAGSRSVINDAVAIYFFDAKWSSTLVMVGSQ
jgi:hypothetical protein